MASVKYFFTLPYALLIGLDFKQALIAVLFGGIGGFLFFYYLSHKFSRLIDFIKPKICRLAPSWVKVKFSMVCNKMNSNNHRKLFTKKNRMFVKIKSTYGYWGIIAATPFILSIPLGAFLTSRYYAHKRHTIPLMILSIVSWTAFFSGIAHIFPRVFF